jgi:hypothetical protein
MRALSLFARTGDMEVSSARPTNRKRREASRVRAVFFGAIIWFGTRSGGTHDQLSAACRADQAQRIHGLEQRRWERRC